jgi:hypothetical protein
VSSLSGDRQLRARLSAIGDTRKLMGTIALLGVREAKLLVPRRTGNLGRTIRVGRVSRTDAEILAGGRNRVGYAAMVEYGTRPHRIVATRARALAWGGPRTLGGRLRKGGKASHFAKSVNHPGTRAHPYLRPGVEAALRKAGIRDGIVAAWNRAAT